MVMLASYESSQYYEGVVTCLCWLWKQAFHLEPREFSLSCDEPDLGLLQTSGLSTGFADGHYKYNMW